MAKNDNATAATEENTASANAAEESSVYDSILSTVSACCCGYLSSCVNSTEREYAFAKQQQRHQTLPPPLLKQQELNEFEKPKLWDRLTNVALYLIQGTPPVNFVKCFECSSVDRSELTLPADLTPSPEFDKTNRSQVDSIWGISEHVTEGTQVINTDVTSFTGTRHLRRKNRFGGSRREKIKRNTSSSDSSYFSWRSRKNPKRDTTSRVAIKRISRGHWPRRSQSSGKSRASHHSNRLQSGK